MRYIIKCLMLLICLLTGPIALSQTVHVNRLSLDKGWQFRKFGDGTWLPATVPGCVHTDLLNNKKIEDPFFRDNETKLQWIDKADWEYQTSFIISNETLRQKNNELVFKGLDTYADVYVNGQLILSADNMFREWVIPVSSILKNGKNTLRVLFKSPINEGIKKYDEYGLPLPATCDAIKTGQVPGDKKVSVFVRKAPYHFGWDWGPRLVTSGVWRPIFLRSWSQALINDVQIIQDTISKAKASITAKVEINATEAQTIMLELTNEGKQGIKVKKIFKLQKGNNIISAPFIIEKPRLWWSNGLGEAYVYHFKIHIRNGKTLIDSKEVSIGLRTLKVIHQSDSSGTAFFFKLNGRPVFAKGANYIPNDVFLNRVTPDKYEHIVKSAADAHMNMLRVWGGGIYENDVFYNLCDKYGIMVWQDFMFACSMYPVDNNEFLENVKIEAIQNIKRLRNHPSIALWCGNNEIYTAWQSWGWKDPYNEKQKTRIWSGYVKLFDQVLPMLLKEYDPQRSYWPSTPFDGLKDSLNSKKSELNNWKNGDNHLWDVWGAKARFNFYNENIPRFCSEYGFQSFPDMNTIKTFALPEDNDINSPVMKLHQKSGSGNIKIKTYMDYDYNTPKDFESFIYMSQVLQAEGIKQAMEAHRRHMPYCMGSLYWQINDCWQAPSWSSIDYFGHWKAQQYYARRSYADVLVSAIIEHGQFNVYTVSDKRNNIKTELDLQILDFSGKKLWGKTDQVTIVHDQSKIAYTAPIGDLTKKFDVNSVIFVAILKEGKHILSSTSFQFTEPRNLRLLNPAISKKVVKRKGDYCITLTCSKVAKNVFLSCSTDGFFSDNYFDLIPGKPVVVTFSPSKNIINFNEKLKIRSLIDSYDGKKDGI